ncbi:sigma-70 family RNA polymerase sigma factor [Embleya sp. NPDC020886]|uniref:sigma-70 family RNA polymerase sigma factor n=1 Tax=Embleya sp. NPDC020886 TaxID=3363980 RepID=UPI003790D117
MDQRQFLATCFEDNRRDLLALAYRMLGSREEAEDAVQDTWLRLERVDAASVRNLPGWLRTVVSRICLDILRGRHVCTEEPSDPLPAPATGVTSGNPEQRVLEAESVGIALLVVLNALSPAERVAFVLHDMFGVPFDEIGATLGRSEAAAKKLASRARHKVREPHEHRRSVELAQHREVVAAFLAAARTGDTAKIAARLAPDVVRRVDAAAVSANHPSEVRGAGAVAREISHFCAAAEHVELAMIDGRVGLLVAPEGRLRLVIRFAIEDGRVREYELLAGRAWLEPLRIRLLPEP